MHYQTFFDQENLVKVFDGVLMVTIDSHIKRLSLTEWKLVLFFEKLGWTSTGISQSQLKFGMMQFN
jgi:hypothetical protein